VKALLVAVLIAALLLPACGGAPVSEVDVPTLREASTSDAVSFHPYLTTDSASSDYQGLQYASGLIRRDENTLAFVPNLAERWDISADGLIYTFHLRHDLLWSDGEPLTAFDFEWTWTQINKPENDYPYLSNLDYITSYTAPDAWTIQVVIDEAFCPALEGADAVTPLPRHIWRDLNWTDPEANPQIMAPTIGSGPYLLKEWVRSDYAIFEANPRYWRGKPQIERYIIRIVPEQEIAFTMLNSGEVDWAPLDPAQYEQTKKSPNLNVYEWWLASGSWQYIGFNLRGDLFQDVRVRQAINYGIDKEAIIRVTMHGLAKRLYSTIVPTPPFFNPDVPHYDYDLAQAKELLRETGFLNRPATNGDKPPPIRLVYGPNGNTTRQAIAVIAQDALRDLGIECEVSGYEWGAYLTLLKDADAWDMSIGGWSATLEPYWMRQIWEAAFIPDLNHIGFNDPHVEQLFQRAAHECDHQPAIYNEIQYILADQSPYVFLFQNLSYTPINKRIKGVRPTPLGVSYNIHSWYIE
jgi:peptide/nickel transport system substrate-binding protein